MWDGKKSTAFKVFYDALEIVETKKDAEKIGFRNLERCIN